MFEDVYCLIPARGGSKGIPHKNIKELCGFPLVSHSIYHAIEAGIPQDHIIVSSDDPKILDQAEYHKVIAHCRPDEISGDYSSTELAMLDALPEIPGCEYLLLLQPTSPIRLKGRISQCIGKIREGYDSLVTSTKFYDFCWYQEEDNWIATYDYQNRPMRQSLGSRSLLHFDNGNIYITRKEILEKHKCRLGGKISVVPITWAEGLQIDTMEDFFIAERMIRGNVGFLSVEIENQKRYN